MSGLLDHMYASPISTMIRDTGFAIPAVQSIHILGISILFGSALICDFKVLGVWRVTEALTLVHRRFYPWMKGAFVAILLSGLVNAVGEPVRVFGNRVFWLKMALLVVAFVLTLLLGRAMKRSDHVALPPASRPIAAMSIAVWVAILICGRWIAYAAS